ncbi:DUF2238 domain-containing protein [Jeotgalibaca sp. MA1X17-3]|uniref:DUF2238 domain-containing protein n=1 Tax=Jeotgalibaca sp. MA1X17-3 TaxID=2908211 RepID=UPI001F3CD529|nr:DUF2238 domain-containing protein [Jeotgalibaca sp. MA1X17-3]UJF16600.1 DUF2238 domain-containing protein [Jeotgalibaca sp. MA1X17-3]
MNKKDIQPNKLQISLLCLSILSLILSAIQPLSPFAWIGQAISAVLLVGVLVVTYQKFQFSNFAYIMVFLHVLILLYGAHYTYAQNPLFNYLREVFGWQRNYYDRVGHFVQGFVPAFLLKELYLKGGYVKKGGMFFFIVIISCLGLSAGYEISEFLIIKILNVPAESVMGMQGDFFDSHWDMLWALIGAMTSIFIFGRFHDKQMEKKWGE